MILVATVEHSGTMRLLDLLGRNARGVCPLEERHRATGELLFAHLYDEMMPLILAFDGPVVTTERNPNDIRASWLRRGRPLEDLDRQMRNYRELLKHKPYIVELGAWR